VTGSFGLIPHVHDLAAQEGSFLIELENFETLPTLRDDIQASVIVGLGHSEDLRCAPDIGKIRFLRAHYPKKELLLKAFADHFLVTWLEDVQRQRRTGKQHDIQWE
jgi:hypothetical protein